MRDTLNTHLSTHSQRQAFKLLSCCSPALSFRTENAKLRQESEKLRWVSSNKRRLCSHWVSLLCLKPAAMCLETSNLIRLGQMRRRSTYSAVLLQVSWTIVCSQVLVRGRGKWGGGREIIESTVWVLLMQLEEQVHAQNTTHPNYERKTHFIEY